MKLLKTCSLEELALNSTLGWTLREIREVQRVEPGGGYSEQINLNGYTSTNYKSHPNVVLSVPVCILELSEEDTFRELTAQLQNCKESLRLAQDNADSSLKAVVALEAKVKALENDKTQAVEEARSLRASLNTERDLKYKMEADIGKLRKEIGEARFREICGDGKK